MKMIFKTVSEDMLPCVEHVVTHLRNGGYRLTIEPSQVGYPSTPAILAKLRPTNNFILVERIIRNDQVQNWVAFGKSCPRDTRITIATDRTPNKKIIRLLRENGVGLMIYDGETIIDMLVAQDLAINLSLPPLDGMPRRISRIMAPIYAKANNSYWREAFEDAFKALEENAKQYLIKYSNSGRIQVMSRGQQVTLARRKIDRLTLGQLAEKYKKIVSPNAADMQIGEALTKINGDRVKTTHKKSRQTTENSLRKNVGLHMWTIVQALKIIDSN